MDHAHHHHHHRPAVVDPGGSLLRAPAGLRLALAGVAIVLIWAAVLWAMAEIA
jgi:hypothetical protein